MQSIEYFEEAIKMELLGNKDAAEKWLNSAIEAEEIELEGQGKLEQGDLLAKQEINFSCISKSGEGDQDKIVEDKVAVTI